MSHVRTTPRPRRRPFLRTLGAEGEPILLETVAAPADWAAPAEVAAAEAIVLERARSGGITLTSEQKLLAIALLLFGLYLAFELGRRSAPTPTEARRRASTDRIAKDLQERLEKNGQGTPAIHRFLSEISRG